MFIYKFPSSKISAQNCQKWGERRESRKSCWCKQNSLTSINYNWYYEKKMLRNFLRLFSFPFSAFLFLCCIEITVKGSVSKCGNEKKLNINLYFTHKTSISSAVYFLKGSREKNPICMSSWWAAKINHTSSWHFSPFWHCADTADE